MIVVAKFFLALHTNTPSSAEPPSPTFPALTPHDRCSHTSLSCPHNISLHLFHRQPSPHFTLFLDKSLSIVHTNSLRLPIWHEPLLHRISYILLSILTLLSSINAVTVHTICFCSPSRCKLLPQRFPFFFVDLSFSSVLTIASPLCAPSFPTHLLAMQL